MLSRKLRSMFGTVVGLAMVLSLVGGSVAQAAALSQTQINAIVSLLQSFGADAGTVANVTASLNGQPTTGGTTTTTSGSGYNFATDLTVGSKGADVTALQQVLVSGGYLTMPAGVAYGYFGSITKAAVIKYQLAKGIAPAAGYFGPKTRASMSGSSVTTTTTTTSTGTDLAVSLAATSPVAGAVINGQAAANLAEYTFTNKSSAPALVTNVTLMRGGVSADTTLNNVYLFSGATRLTESATVSSGKITFNAGAGLFTVPAGGSVTVAVKADILSTAAAGQTVNVSLTGVTSNVAVAAVYPISGSTMTVATASDLATVTLASTSVSTTLEAGSINQTIWGSSFTQAGRAVYLKSLAVKVIGSVPADSFQNLKLFVSGVQVATATGVDANGMITFDLTSNPYKIDSSRNLEIRADIVNGSTRTFSVSLQNVADIQVIDSNYNIGISVAGTLPTTNTITVSGGTLAISLDSTLGSSDVVLGSTGVSLAKYTVKAYGENMKTSYLKVAASQDLTNVTLYLNGSSISSSQNVSSTTATTFSLGSSMIINAGTTATLEIRGDLKNAAGTSIATSSTVIVTLQSYTNNTQGSYSSALTTYPATSIVGPTLTVVGAGLVIAKNASYNDTTLVANSNGFKIGSFVLSSNASEPVRITGMTVKLFGTMPVTSLSNLYTSENTSKVNPQASNNFGVDFTIPSNGSKTVDIFADIGAIASVANAADTQTFAIASTTPGVAIVAAKAASSTLSITSGDATTTATIMGIAITKNVPLPSVETTTTIAAALVSLINANTQVNGYVTAASTLGVVTITANTAGTVGNSYTASSTNATVNLNTGVLSGGAAATTGTAQEITITPANVEVGDVFTVAIQGTTVSYTAVAATVADVTAGLLAAIGTNTYVTAAASSTLVLTSKTGYHGVNSPTIATTATNGTHSTTNTLLTGLILTANGLTSNIDASTATSTLGQTLTVGTGALGTPTLTSASPVSQLVIGPSTGSAVGTFNFKATTGAATITKLGFTLAEDSLTNAITSITVGGVTKTVAVGATTTISGLSIAVPVTNAGTDVPVTVSYNTVGVGGIASAASTTLVVGSVEYQSGNTTATNYVYVPANKMTVVAAYPTIAVAVGSSNNLVNGVAKLADITVTAVGNKVKITTIGVTVATTGVLLNSAILQLKDGNTQVASTTAVADDGANDLEFNDGGYILTAGQSKTFSLYGTVTEGDGTGNSVVTQLGAAAALDWYDVEGDSVVLHADLIPSYSLTNSYTLVSAN